ncbi:hypothetical protein [Microbacterium aurum]
MNFLGSTASLADVDVVFASENLSRLLRIKRDTTPAERLDKTRRFVAQLEEWGVALVRPAFGPLRSGAPEYAESTRLLDDATTMFVAVEDSTETPAPARTVPISSAEWSERFAGYPTRRQTRARLLALSVGRMPPQAIAAVTGLPTRRPGTTVSLVGLSSETGHSSALSGDSIATRVGRLSDAAMIEEITAAEMVVMPKVETLTDLQLLMMVLTFRRPLVVPATSHVTSLAAEVGSDWMSTHRGALTSEVLERAMGSASRGGDSIASALSRRSLHATADRYAAVFRQASEIARAGRRPPIWQDAGRRE